MGRRRKRPEVEGYQDHESAVSKIAADLGLDPDLVNRTIRAFFSRITTQLNKMQNIYLDSFGKFNKTEYGRMTFTRKIKDKKNAYNEYQRLYQSAKAAKKTKIKKEIEMLDPWEQNELDAKRNPEKWKDRITLEK